MKKNWKYSLMLIVTVLTVSMGVFFLLYRFDNKYTAKGDQPIQGILYVPDDDSVHYLAREWEYYPDVLLTPQELKENKGKYYSRYISIGIRRNGSWRQRQISFRKWDIPDDTCASGEGKEICHRSGRGFFFL